MKKNLMKSLSSMLTFSTMIVMTIGLTFACVTAYEGQTHLGIIALALSAIYTWIILRVDDKLDDKIRKEEQKCELQNRSSN